jgi:hypothetical protein
MAPQELLERLGSELEDLVRVMSRLKADETLMSSDQWADEVGSIGHRLIDIESDLGY